MVALADPKGKGARRWKQPPWTEQSPEWRSIDAELPSDDVARRIDRAVDLLLNLDDLEQSYAGRGQEAYPPGLLLKVVLYAKNRGWHRPSQWYYQSRYNRVCQWLMRGLWPSRSCWYAFAQRIAPRVDGWNAQLLAIAVQARVTTATRGVQDGTLIAAHATRHKLVGQEKIVQRLDVLSAALSRDAAGQPVEYSGTWVAKTPRGRHQQQRRYRVLFVQMTRRQEENRQRPKSEQKPPEKLRLSPGDPEAPLGLDKQRVFRPLYNVQLIDDLDSPLILAYDAFDQTSDNGTLKPMLACHHRLTGVALCDLLADSKYTTPADLAICDQAGVALYGYTQEQVAASRKAATANLVSPQIPKSQFVWLEEKQAYQCPEGHPLSYRAMRTKCCAGGETVRTMVYACRATACQACPRRPQCTPRGQAGREVRRSEYEPLVEALTTRMQTPEAQTLYRCRQQTVELVFADFKEHRCLTRFSGHGLTAARAEVGLSVLVHNALALLPALRRPIPTPRPPPAP